MEVAIQGDKSYKTINHLCQEMRELVFNQISLKIIKKLLLIFAGITTGILVTQYITQIRSNENDVLIDIFNSLLLRSLSLALSSKILIGVLLEESI